MSLNENQARALTNGLRLLEQRLVLISRLVEEEESGRLYRRSRPDLPADARAGMQDLIGQIRIEIDGLADQFSLPPHVHRPLRQAVGLLAVSWETLGNLHSEHLGGFGSVNPVLRDTLDPSIERLMDLVLRLERTAAANADRHHG